MVRRLVLNLTVVTACILGGVLAVASGSGGAPITVPPTVNATNWSSVSAPTPSAANLNQLNGTSCASASFCVAVGQSDTSGGSLIEQWNGTSWSIVNATTTPGDVFLGVSCVGPSFCMAVGYTSTTTLAEEWNGSTWSVLTAPSLPGSEFQPQLYGVSCVSTSWCMAAGLVNVSSGLLTFAEQWNGTSWTVVPSPNPATAGDSLLFGISCASSLFCVTVGEADTHGVAPINTLVEQWNGSAWAIVPSPNSMPSSSSENELESVSCDGTGFCMAAGFSVASGAGTDKTLVEEWNGSSWSIVPTPNAPGDIDNFLDGVDCFSPTTCTAVGTATTAGGADNLALAWNGSSWSLAAASNASGAVSTQSYAVSCVTDWVCVAVGRFKAPSIYQPFIMSAPIARSGYRFVATDGGIFDYGAGAPFLGSMGGTHLNKPVVGMAVMPAGDGYDLVASDGGIFTFGSAQFYGSTGSLHLNKPVVGMALTADGAGYWLVASDGGIFSYGDAQFYGSTGSLTLNRPIVGMAATPDGKGYWLVASDGGIFNYGDASFLGSAGSLVLNKPVVGMAAPVGGGYYLVATDGGIFTYPATGGPPFFGSTGSLALNKPVVGMTAVAGGYYLSGSDGGVFAYPATGGPPFLGSTGSIALNAPIVGIAG